MSPGIDPYAGSTALGKLRRSLEGGGLARIACLDIDSTLTGDRAAADVVRARLERAGYVVVFDTSRTEEMVMSSGAYRASRERGDFHRLPPHLGREGDRHVYVPPENVEPWGVLDGDAIAGSTGTILLLRQADGSYLPDTAYTDRYGVDPAAWRADVTRLIHRLEGEGCPGKPAGIEDRGRYDAGLSDVAPPEYRVQMDFKSVGEKLRWVAGAKGALWAAHQGGEPWARSIWPLRITDDSRPDTAGYKVFLTPRTGSKVRAIERLVDRFADALGVDQSRFSLLFAGDSFPDLAMGLLGGLGTDATLLLVGGSRLVEPLTGGGGTFVGEPIDALRRRLEPCGPAGHYRFRLPLPGLGERRLVAGDAVYPGTEAVETVARYVEEVVGRQG